MLRVKGRVDRVAVLSQVHSHPGHACFYHGIDYISGVLVLPPDETILTRFRDHVRDYLRPDQDPYYGDQRESVESFGGGFQAGYLARTIIDYLEEVRAQEDWQAYAEGFNYLSGVMEWNLNYGNFPYYRGDTQLYYRTSGLAL